MRKVSGDTGVANNLTQVNYSGSTYLNDNLVLSSIGGLNVQSGNLAPAAGSSFFGNDAPLTIASGATLGLQKLGDEVAVGNFTGGGALVLEQNQKLVVSGTISGTTTVGIGGIFNGHSQTIPTVGNTYIDAANSNADSFTLAAPASRPDIKLVRDANGAWTAKADESLVIVKDFALSSKVANPDEEITPDSDNSNGPLILWSTSLPFAFVAYASESTNNLLASIQLNIKVNEGPTSSSDEEDFGYCFSHGRRRIYRHGQAGGRLHMGGLR